MSEISLVAIADIISATVSIVCAAVLWLRRKSALWENTVISYFFFAFVFAAFVFFLFALPGTLIFDPLIIRIVQKTADSFIMLLTIYLVSIPLAIFPQTKGRRFTDVAFWVISIYSIFCLAYNFIFLKPSKKVSFGPFVDWQGPDQPILQGLVWLFTAAGIAMIVYLFVSNGWAHEDPFIKKRSRIFSIGFLIIFLGWLLVFLFTSPASKNITLLLAGGSGGAILMSLGLIFLMWGIFTRPKTDA